MTIDIEELRIIIDNRTKVGTMSRDYGHHVDDVLHIENSYELTLVDNALTELERLQKRDEDLKSMLNDKIKSNNVLLEKGYWNRIAYENQILNNVLKMLDWSDEK